ncbi:hypothetical protein Cgig2_007003 [Carnegiea gigantea]|uniref:NADP-dependent oxidoreductase domain-containing protein n=1 Tax=Carnegiea gigantea TaxID=171969 RepID=A0A9Q1QFC3_9CARY|nr:hypothetical protein Cgig2_007003 [Carnegiea gigantea]
MPVLGLGIAPNPLVPDETKKTATIEAVEVGCPHCDIATIHISEEALGEGINEVLAHGMIESREELFITSKLWCADAHPHLVLPALKRRLTSFRPHGCTGSHGSVPKTCKGNFTCKKLAELLAFATIPPPVNQMVQPDHLLRWPYEQGIAVVAKSLNKERMKQNLGIFSRELSHEDHEKICTITQGRMCTGLDHTSQAYSNS